MAVPYAVAVAISWLTTLFCLIAFSTTYWMSSEGTFDFFGIEIDLKIHWGLWRASTTFADDTDDSSIDCDPDESKSCDYWIATQTFATLFLVLIVIVSIMSTVGLTVKPELKMPKAWGGVMAAACVFCIVAAATWAKVRSRVDGDDDEVIDAEFDWSFYVWLLAILMSAITSGLFFVADEGAVRSMKSVGAAQEPPQPADAAAESQSADV